MEQKLEHINEEKICSYCGKPCIKNKGLFCCSNQRILRDCNKIINNSITELNDLFEAEQRFLSEPSTLIPN